MKSSSPFLKPLTFALVFIIIIPFWMTWRGYEYGERFKWTMSFMFADSLVAAIVVGAWASWRKASLSWRSALSHSFLLSSEWRRSFSCSFMRT